MKYLPSSNWCTYCTAHGSDPEVPRRLGGTSSSLCALSSGKDIRVWQYLRSFPQSIYRQQPARKTPQSDRCASTIDIVEPVFGGLWARNVSIGRRAVVTGKGGADRTTKYESVPPEQSIRMHATRGSTHTVTVPLPYRYRTVPPTSSPKAKLRTDQCAHARCARSRMLTRAGAQPKRGRDSQPPTHPRITPKGRAWRGRDAGLISRQAVP